MAKPQKRNSKKHKAKALPLPDDFYEAFPNLRTTAHRVTSSNVPHYNCIAWAVHDATRWWEPIGDGLPSKGYFWPSGVPREQTVTALKAAYATVGFQHCADEAKEAGFEKLAIFADSVGRFKHAAKLLVSGRWSSKLGKEHDIEHELRALEGAAYGHVIAFMKRAKPQ